MIDKVTEIEKIFLGRGESVTGEFEGQIQKYTAVQNQRMTQLER